MRFVTRVDRLSWLCLLALAGATPLFNWSRSDDTVRTVQWSFVWAASALGVAAGWASGRLTAAAAGPLAIPLAAFVAVRVALLPFAFRPATALADTLNMLAGAGAAWLAASWCRDRRRRRAIAGAAIVAGLLVAVYGMFQYFGMDFNRWAISYGGQRPFATLGNPNFLAGHIAMLAPLAVGMFIAADHAGGRVPWGLLGFAWLFLIFIAQTRGAWIATGAALAYLLWTSRHAAPAAASSRRGWLGAFAAALLATGTVVAVRNPELMARVADLIPHDFGQIAKRYTATRAGLFAWRERPLAGYGAGCFKHAFGTYMAKAMPHEEKRQFAHTFSEQAIHCDPLQILAETGVIGFGVLAWIALTALGALRRAPDRVAARALLACGIAIGIHGSFNLPMQTAPTSILVWIGVGVAAAMARDRAGGSAPASAVPADRHGSRFMTALLPALIPAALGAVLIAVSGYNRLALDFRNFAPGFPTPGEQMKYWMLSGQTYDVALKLDWDDRREAFYAASMRAQWAGMHTPPAAEMLRESVAVYAVELARNPFYMDGYTNLGSVHGLLGQLDLAEAQFRRGIELNPAYAEAHANLGVALLQQKKFGEAVESFARALEIEPEMSLAQNGMALARARKKP